MINHIAIRDFAVIQNTSVDFSTGLNIITGETGAGKSVVIEGISLALGARADSSFIRTGCEKASVSLSGELDGEEIVISREISANGKNLCKLNGEIVTLGELRQTAEKLADIHGQYDNQFLLNPDNHIQFLDQYGKANISSFKDSVKEAYLDFSEKKSELTTLLKNEREMKQKLDFYQYQLKDIDSLNLAIGEDEALEEEINLLQNSEKIYENLEAAYSMNLDSIYQASKALEEISSFTKDIDEISKGVSSAYYDLEDLQSSIRSIKDSITFSPAELDSKISRLQAINEAKKKYGNTIELILKYRDEINEILGDTIDLEHKKQTLANELKESKDYLLAQCAKLTDMRKALAGKLENEISSQLEDLNFNNSELKVQFTALDEPTINGMESVEILISTNKGEALKPLAKIASGGEMSRIMLAFKKIEAPSPTLIFDEIDNGISGVTASIVSKKLKEIAKDHQILCITHLPQIAASGDTNYRIIKDQDNSHTYTTIQRLTDDEKVGEIARLLGGTNITDITLESAKELIQSTKGV
ncbi:MAG: DNA repair protein RecN [Clostridia bacterium]|nr:DNA repair protein RecN [Clostridia bacterium]